LYREANIIRVVNFGRSGWARHIARNVKSKNSYRIKRGNVLEDKKQMSGLSKGSCEDWRCNYRRIVVQPECFKGVPVLVCAG
jgi:hypothetical protein